MAEPDPAAARKPVDNRVFVLVLQHPHERREPRATAAAAVATLRRARLVTGLSWPNLTSALGRRADPRRWGVLYLGSVRPRELAGAGSDREIVVLGRGVEPIPDAGTILAGLEGIVLLDGTWSQAKALWWRNPWLLKCRRVVLGARRPSRYGALRREPRRDGLATIEAVAQLIGRIEGRPELTAALEASFTRLLERYRATRRPGRPARRR